MPPFPGQHEGVHKEKARTLRPYPAAAAGRAGTGAAAGAAERWGSSFSSSSSPPPPAPPRPPPPRSCPWRRGQPGSDLTRQLGGRQAPERPPLRPQEPGPGDPGRRRAGRRRGGSGPCACAAAMRERARCHRGVSLFVSLCLWAKGEAQGELGVCSGVAERCLFLDISQSEHD